MQIFEYYIFPPMILFLWKKKKELDNLNALLQKGVCMTEWLPNPFYRMSNSLYVFLDRIFHIIMIQRLWIYLVSMLNIVDSKCKRKYIIPSYLFTAKSCSSVIVINLFSLSVLITFSCAFHHIMNNLRMLLVDFYTVFIVGLFIYKMVLGSICTRTLGTIFLDEEWWWWKLSVMEKLRFK